MNNLKLTTQQEAIDLLNNGKLQISCRSKVEAEIQAELIYELINDFINHSNGQSLETFSKSQDKFTIKRKIES